ncbi:hypothetical protein SCHPADRAFT_752609 [Schizopora paradoxa]|uniref:Uncharacterized protein n=1 Tax=Schizopora paradoxa TaxID=27342 RepID=A0A0H2RI39_9AGAM|nr:hypothetical protein SCHPADRAFT_752609 [Schizopora paradoxa]
MATKNSEAYDRAIVALGKNKLISKSLLRLVAKTVLEEFCAQNNLEVGGKKLKDDCIDAIRNWHAKLISDRTAHIPSNFLPSVHFPQARSGHEQLVGSYRQNDNAPPTLASTSILPQTVGYSTSADDSELGRLCGMLAAIELDESTRLPESHPNVDGAVTNEGDLVPLLPGFFPPGDARMGFYFPHANSSPLTSFAASYQAQASQTSHYTMPTMASQAFSNANSRTHLPGSEVQPIGLNEAEEYSGHPTAPDNSKDKTKDKSNTGPREIEARLYEKPKDWRYLKVSNCILEPNGDLIVTHLDDIFGLPDHLTCRVKAINFCYFKAGNRYSHF